jgi:ribonuclease HII
MRYPNLKEEKKLWKKGYKVVVGLDEAGRGPLAGPVVATAVYIIPNSELKIPKLRDSKKLTPKKREEFFRLIVKNHNIKWGIGKVSEKVIDKINIFEATKLAMKKAIESLKKKLKRKVDFLILDGNFKIDLEIPQKPIVKGDEKVLSCAMASIIAKVTRDKIMEKYAEKFPEYGFEKHKGYGTKFHLKMLRKYGPCKIHRKSFLPVAKI